MDTTAPDVLEKQINELAQRVARLEAEVTAVRQSRAISGPRTSYAPAAQRIEPVTATLVELPERAAREKAPTLPPNVPPASADIEPIVAQLYADGVLVRPSAEWLAWVRELEAEWEAVPEEEKRAAEEELRNLRLDPPLSEIIIRMRGGWYPDESEWVDEAT